MKEKAKQVWQGVFWKNVKVLFMEEGHYSPGKFLANELAGITKNEAIYFVGLLIIQMSTFVLTNDSAWLSVITGVANICCVFLGAKQKISNYIFGLIFSGLYFFVSLDAFALGEVALAAFFFGAQFAGLYSWVNNSQNDEEDGVAVISEKLSLKQWGITIGCFVIIYSGSAYILMLLSSNAPITDAITNSLNIVGTVLMARRFREQWLIWILENIFSIILWSQLGNIPMIGMNIALLINSIYGYVAWSLSLKKRMY